MLISSLEVWRLRRGVVKPSLFSLDGSTRAYIVCCSVFRWIDLFSIRTAPRNVLMQGGSRPFRSFSALRKTDQDGRVGVGGLLGIFPAALPLVSGLRSLKVEDAFKFTARPMQALPRIRVHSRRQPRISRIPETPEVWTHHGRQRGLNSEKSDSIRTFYSTSAFPAPKCSPRS